VVWTSADGPTWTRIFHSEPTFGGDGNQSMLAVTQGGPGLVAVGYDSSGGNKDAAVWTSSDGATWALVPSDEHGFAGPGHQELLELAATDDGLLATGYEQVGRDRETAVCTSPDGISWERSIRGLEAFGGDGHQLILAVTAGDSGLVAVGSSDGDAAV